MSNDSSDKRAISLEEKTDLVRKLLRERLEKGDHSLQDKLLNSNPNQVGDVSLNQFEIPDVTETEGEIFGDDWNALNNSQPNVKSECHSKSSTNSQRINISPATNKKEPQDTDESGSDEKEDQIKQDTPPKFTLRDASNNSSFSLTSAEHAAVTAATQVLRPSIQSPSVAISPVPVIPAASNMISTVNPAIPNIIPHYPSNMAINATNSFTGNILAGTFMPTPNIYNNQSLYNPVQVPNNNGYIQSEFMHHDYNYSDDYYEAPPPPSTVQDYYWLCFQFKSGSRCKYGRHCQWRHYDFHNQADVATTWNYQLAQNNPPTLSAKQMAKAQKLKTRMEKLFPWLTASNTANNAEIKLYDDYEHQYERIISLMQPFDAPKNTNFDYYSLGKLALQQLQSIQQRKANNERLICSTCFHNNVANALICQMCQSNL